MHALTKDEIVRIGGGGNANGNYEGMSHSSSSSFQQASTNYGGQANGFVGNTAAAGHGLLQGNCSNNVAAGVVGGILTGNPAGFGASVAAGAIAGGCFNDSGNDKNGGSSNSSAGSSNCGSGGIGGTCSH